MYENLMLLFLNYIFCYKYHVKLCKLDNEYIQTPAEIPSASGTVSYTPLMVSFSKIMGPQNIRIIQSELLPGYVMHKARDNSVLFMPFYDIEDEYFEIVPYDYSECYRIAFNGECLSYNTHTKEMKIEACEVHSNTNQLFEFECLDCPSYVDSYYYGEKTTNYMGEEKEIEKLEYKMGRLDITSYKKLKELEKLMRNISRCFTINGTCNEHFNEEKPLSCFTNFNVAHHLLDNNYGSDKIHHLRDPSKNIDDLIGVNKYDEMKQKNDLKEQELENRAAILETLNSETNINNRISSTANSIKTDDSVFELPEMDDFKRDALNQLVSTASNLKDKIVTDLKNTIGSRLLNHKKPDDWFRELLQKAADLKDTVKKQLNDLSGAKVKNVDKRREYVDSILNNVLNVKKVIGKQYNEKLNQNLNALQGNAKSWFEIMVEDASELKTNTRAALKNFIEDYIAEPLNESTESIINTLSDSFKYKNKTKNKVSKAISRLNSSFISTKENAIKSVLDSYMQKEGNSSEGFINAIERMANEKITKSSANSEKYSSSEQKSSSSSSLTSHMQGNIRNELNLNGTKMPSLMNTYKNLQSQAQNKLQKEIQQNLINAEKAKKYSTSQSDTTSDFAKNILNDKDLSNEDKTHMLLGKVQKKLSETTEPKSISCDGVKSALDCEDNMSVHCSSVPNNTGTPIPTHDELKSKPTINHFYEPGNADLPENHPKSQNNGSENEVLNSDKYNNTTSSNINNNSETSMAEKVPKEIEKIGDSYNNSYDLKPGVKSIL